MSSQDVATGLPSPRILRLPDVLARTGLARETLRRLELAGTFPARIRLSARTVGWLESEVDHWVAARVARQKAFAGASEPAVRVG